MIDRSRMTEKVNFSLLQLEAKRALKPLAIIALGVVVTLGGAYYIISNINGGIGGTHQMKFEMADVTGAVPNRAVVKFYGIEAGKVTDAQLIDGHAVVTATVATKFGNVYKNATAQLRPNTALEDMYLDITNRGTPSAGVAGPNYVIPQSQTQSPVNLSAVLNVFQPDVRTQMYNLLDQFGNGLADRGYALKRAFTLLAPFIQVAGNIANQLAERATLTKQFVHNASTLSAILASRSTQLHNFVVHGTQTLEALSTEGGQPLRQTISEVGPSLNQVYATWQALHTLQPTLTDALDKLQPVASDLPSALSSLKAFSVSARPALQTLQRPVTELTPMAQQLQPFTQNLSTAVDRIKPQVSDFDTAAHYSAKCVAFIDEFFNWDYSMSKFSDDYGPFVRGNVHVGFYSLPGGSQPNYVSDYACGDNSQPVGGAPTPKYNGPPPAP
jgi:ABC-type transporter Mla subunit MlaD